MGNEGLGRAGMVGRVAIIDCDSVGTEGNIDNGSLGKEDNCTLRRAAWLT